MHVHVHSYWSFIDAQILTGCQNSALSEAYKNMQVNFDPRDFEAGHLNRARNKWLSEYPLFRKLLYQEKAFTAVKAIPVFQSSFLKPVWTALTRVLEVKQHLPLEHTTRVESWLIIPQYSFADTKMSHTKSGHDWGASSKWAKRAIVECSWQKQERGQVENVNRLVLKISAKTNIPNIRIFVC